MDVVDNDPVAIHSSIALLQERFKQLHREKRQREERELLRLFSSRETISIGDTQPTSQYINHASKRMRLFCSEILLKDIPPLKELSLWPSSTINCQTELWDAEAPVAKKMRREDRIALWDSSFQLDHFESDVDTSLHL